MASSYNNAQIQVARIGMPIDIIVGNLAAIMNLCVFCQKSMRRNSCGIFLIAWSVLTLLHLNYIVLSSSLARGFGIDPSTSYSIYCHIRLYCNGVINILLICFLIAASVDRALVSSANARIRLWSSRRRALLAIVIMVVVWMCILIPNLFFSDILLINGGSSKTCNFIPGAPNSVITAYVIIGVNVIPLVLLTGCGIKTLHNIRTSRVQRRPLLQSKDRILVLLLLLQIVLFIILRTPTAMNYFYLELTQGRSKSIDQLAFDSLLATLVLFLQFTHVALSPLINFLTRGFRTEFRKAIMKFLGIQSITGDDSSTRRNGQIQQSTRLNRNAIHPATDIPNTVVQY